MTPKTVPNNPMNGALTHGSEHCKAALERIRSAVAAPIIAFSTDEGPARLPPRPCAETRILTSKRPELCAKLSYITRGHERLYGLCQAVTRCRIADI